ncbi:hypothetical protein OUZ56_029483 [Daphnia magna]|uniref:Uncharacterized protein n=1 Tax=Daphnia magna TaxID=35525 RepID=A0ABR0B6Y0_9CRUS|nr:hypothetical protein OUZ56_029483 [Daphnia magna]
MAMLAELSLKEVTVSVARTALPLPTFNGDITAWKGWRLMWATYDQNPQLSEIEKFQYLRNALKGKVAECIAHQQFSKKQYKNVLDKLENRFGDQKKLKSHYTTELKKLLATRLPNTARTEQLQKIYDGLDGGGYKWIEEGDPDVNAILKELSKEIKLKEIEEGRPQQTREPFDFRKRPQDRPVGKLAPCCFCQQNHLHHRWLGLKRGDIQESEDYVCPNCL